MMCKSSFSRCHLTGLIATGCGDDTIRIFKEDLVEGSSSVDQPCFELIATVNRAHTMDINTVAWNPVQPGLLASCSDDGDVKLWQVEDS